MANIEIRTIIKSNRLRHYEIAKTLGISEYTFCKWMREELSEDRKQIVLNAISKLLAKGA